MYLYLSALYVFSPELNVWPLTEEGGDPIKLQAPAARYRCLHDVSQLEGDPLRPQPPLPAHEYLPHGARHLQCCLQV